MFELVIKGFTSNMHWYSGQGEQDSFPWFEEHCDGNVILTDDSKTFPIKWEENQTTLTIFVSN